MAPIRRRLRLVARAAALALIAAPGALAQEQKRFDVPEGDLIKSVQSFSEQSSVFVYFDKELLEGRQGRALNGSYTEEDAIRLLLNGSGVTFTKGAGNAIFLTEASAQQADTAVRQTTTARPAEPQDAGETEVIVVTGTNIRGIAPESSPTIVFDKTDIDRSGFLTTDEFIQSIPQNFGGGANNVVPFGVPDSSESASNNVLAAGINIRGLDAGSTLTLLNGRRLSPAGLNGGFVDVSSIPLSAIERVEILTDGASSIYGGDAVAGVVNFVMNDEFEGAETSLSYGRTTEGGRNEFRANQLLGASWGSGNGFVSYEFVSQDLLLAEEKDFAAAAPDPLSLLPEQDRHSVIANFSQEITPDLEFNLSGYYANRSTERIFNRSFDDQPLEFQPVQFENGDSEQFLIAPSVSFDVDDNWRIVLAGDHSQTIGDFARQDLDKTTNELGPLRTQRNDASQSSVDLIADGALFEIPGGPVKIAVGGAFRRETFQFAGTSGIVSVDEDRDVWAAFGELFVPIVGDANAMPALRRLELSASVRHDDYSDFGASTNPKFGLLWSPVEGLSFRGSYSTSFNPPDLGFIGNPDTSGSIFPTLDPETGGLDLQYFLLAGNDVNSGAEESESFTAGMDYNGEVFGGDVSVSASYYNIKFDDRIGVTPIPPGLDAFNILASRDGLPTETFIESPSRADIDFLIGLTDESGLGTFDVVELFTGEPANLDNIAFIVDFSTRNLASTETDGIDFDVTYSRLLGPGELSLGLAGNYILDFQNQASATSPVIQGFNRVFNPVDFRARGSIAWSTDAFTASAFINHTDSYTNDRVDPSVPVDSWTTVDLNLGYSFDSRNGPKLINGTRVAVSVRNLFDQDPPFIEGSDNFSVSFFDGTNATPLGRFVSFNVVKRW